MRLVEFINDSVVTNEGVFMIKEGIDHIEALPIRQ